MSDTRDLELIKSLQSKKLVNKIEIDSILIKFNLTFSTYIPTSEI